MWYSVDPQLWLVWYSVAPCGFRYHRAVISVVQCSSVWFQVSPCCMGESTSVFIRRFVKLKCAYGDLRILTISRIFFFFFFSISFHNLVRSIHPTTCRSMFSEANACARVAGSGENYCELVGSVLYTSEKSRAVWKKCRVCQRAMSFPWPLTKMWKTNGTGSGFRRWMRTEYRFNTDVESSMSWGLQLKKTKNYQLKNQWKGERNWAQRWTSDPSSRNLV